MSPDLHTNSPGHIWTTLYLELHDLWSFTLFRSWKVHVSVSANITLRLKCYGTRAETRFRLSAKWTSPFKSAGASVQSPTDSRGVLISGSNAGYTMFRGSVKGTGYPLHSSVSPSLLLPCLTVCHHVLTGLYCRNAHRRSSLTQCHVAERKLLISSCMKVWNVCDVPKY